MQKIDDEIQKIRDEANRWLTVQDKKDLAEDFGITTQQVYKLLNGKSSGKRSYQRIVKIYEKAMSRRQALKNLKAEYLTGRK